MPVFTVEAPELRYSPEQKQRLAQACSQALNDGFGLPLEDKFVVIQEHSPDGMVLDPAYMGMRRSADAIIITVLIGAQRPPNEKRAFVKALNAHAAEALGISPDDIFIAMIPVPVENFSFGRGELQLAGPEA